MPENDISDEEVEAQRQEVEELRRQSIVAEQEAGARLTGADNAVTSENLKREAEFLRNKIAVASSVGIVPEGGWPKPEATEEFVAPMGTLAEVPAEATPLYIPGPGEEEPAGSTVLTTPPLTPPTLTTPPMSTPPLTSENQE